MAEHGVWNVVNISVTLLKKTYMNNGYCTFAKKHQAGHIPLPTALL